MGAPIRRSTRCGHNRTTSILLVVGVDFFEPAIQDGAEHFRLGAGCIVLKGVTIGEGSVVGMGSVVTRDVPPRVVVAGNPARVIKPVPPADTPGEGANPEGAMTWPMK